VAHGARQVTPAPRGASPEPICPDLEGERGLFAPALLVARPALTGFVPLCLIVGTSSCESTRRGYAEEAKIGALVKKAVKLRSEVAHQIHKAAHRPALVYDRVRCRSNRHSSLATSESSTMLPVWQRRTAGACGSMRTRLCGVGCAVELAGSADTSIGNGWRSLRTDRRQGGVLPEDMGNVNARRTRYVAAGADVDRVRRPGRGVNLRGALRRGTTVPGRPGHAEHTQSRARAA
jgi:hypothetical protein